MSTATRTAAVDVNQLFASWPLYRPGEQPSHTATSLPSPHSVSQAALLGLAQLRHIGTLADRYLLLEGQGRDLVLVDQAAAHERVLRHKLIQAMKQGPLVQQRLLFPIPLAVDKATMTRFSVVGPRLPHWGFEVEAFGALSLLIRGVPELVAAADPKPLLLDVLNAAGTAAVNVVQAAEHGSGSLPPDVLAALARHVCVPESAREPLGIASLLAELDGLGAEPDPRPVAVRLPLHELQARFGRT